MKDLISREAVLSGEFDCMTIERNGKIYANLADVNEHIKSIPAVKVVPLKDIYGVIAGHSDYHGDNILAALTCIAEGKEVNLVKPLAPAVDAVEVVHGQWVYKWDAEKDPKRLFIRVVCSNCNLHTGQKSNYCPNCGARMDGE